MTTKTNEAENLPERIQNILACQVHHSVCALREALLLHLVPGHPVLPLHPGDDDHLIARPPKLSTDFSANKPRSSSNQNFLWSLISSRKRSPSTRLLCRHEESPSQLGEDPLLLCGEVKQLGG